MKKFEINWREFLAKSKIQETHLTVVILMIGFPRNDLSQ